MNLNSIHSYTRQIQWVPSFLSWTPFLVQETWLEFVVIFIKEGEAHNI